jgi:hypothetical protein
VLETTVIEMLLKLIPQPPNALLNFCGRDICILREHVEEIASVNLDAHTLIGPEFNKWLEMDMR